MRFHPRRLPLALAALLTLPLSLSVSTPAAAAPDPARSCQVSPAVSSPKVPPTGATSRDRQAR